MLQTVGYPDFTPVNTPVRKRGCWSGSTFRGLSSHWVSGNRKSQGFRLRGGERCPEEGSECQLHPGSGEESREQEGGRWQVAGGRGGGAEWLAEESPTGATTQPDGEIIPAPSRPASPPSALITARAIMHVDRAIITRTQTK